MKIIGRLSKKGNMYYQTAIKEEGMDEAKFYPVFVKKSLEGKFDIISREKKVDKKGAVYELIEVADSHVFRPEVAEGEEVKFVITK